jgi:hypothetical protein
MQKINVVLRIISLVSPFIFPWWISAILVCAALFYFEKFYEIILIGLFFDVLYHSTNTSFGLYGFTLISCVIFVFVTQIKERLIVY